MPIAVVVGMSFVAVLYVSTNLSFFVVLSVDEMLSSSAVGKFVRNMN
jgi:hypothetical protein